MASRLNHLLDHYRRLRDRGESAVLATITETMGSTYQKAGARMLITSDGRALGLLSGGCFENDLCEQAAPVLADGRARQVFYDMRAPEEAVWGLGLGCNGAVRLLMQRLTADTGYRPLNRIAEMLDNHQAGILATVCDSDRPALPAGESVFIDPQGIDDRPTGVVEVDRQLALQARRARLEDRPRLDTIETGDGTLTVFYDLIQPPPRLLVIGAGPDAVPVVRLAAELGWRVTLVDHRPAYLEAPRFPGAAELLNCHPDELVANADPDRFAALVLMTHNIDYDERYLKALAGSAVPYIGLLGPAKRRQRLLDSLGEHSADIVGRTFGPVGLDLGAQTPEEIALSIVAEIQAFIKQRDGASLSSKDQPIQERAAPN